MTTPFIWHTTMKVISYLTVFLVIVGIAGFSAMAQKQEAAKEPLITLSVKDEPLGDVLDTITAETGYQFKLNEQWQDWPVSATIGSLPLEKGLKRLLRSLNYTIVWESERTLSIMVYGKAEPGGSGPAVPFRAPPPVEQEMAEPESVDQETQEEPPEEEMEDASESEAGDLDNSKIDMDASDIQPVEAIPHPPELPNAPKTGALPGRGKAAQE
ncbi:hypothetical protein DESC_970037 [Desulfosarcina cetonica]|uniref:hypothetical protein n=1 Tax=Desulfosarcina cetonica TaxID=90730 RepID=UPI0012ED4AD2|nr:hypothetical protein [Desulfosarcina cetonica]VTR71546.1 hypothetical protein DESC_970037 [Desulfosarcina cetonica]